MALKYRARQIRASPWWQCLQACLGDFFGNYPIHYAEAMGPLRPVVSVSLRAFLRCGDLAQGFARTFEDSGLGVPIRSDAEESQVTDQPLRTKRREDGLLLVFDAKPPPPDDLPVFWTD